MKRSVMRIKTLVLLSTIAFAGHVLAAQDPWFSGTAEGDDLTSSAANWDTNVVGEVTVVASALSIDLPTNTVVKLTPTSSESNKKTYVVVDDAVFTPTAYEDIDNSVVVGAQTALTVAYDANNATNYYAYITNNWVKLSGADPVETPVDVTIVLDYSDAAQTNVSFTVGTTELQDDFGNKQFPIATASERSLSRVELAGYGKIHSITSTVEAVANVTVTPGTVTYGADFTNVTITATVDGTGYDTATYSLTWNGSTVGTFTRDGNTITITAPINHPAAGRAPATYVINVNDVAGELQNTVVADENEWVNENAGTTGETAAGGDWSNAVVYAESVADISDNTFTAVSETTGDQVKITFKDLTYAELSDLSVATPEGTQGAFALAENDGATATNFYVLAWENNGYAWNATTCETAAAVGGTYTVVMTFDYVSTNYSVTVNGNALKINNNDKFPLCVSKASVKDFVFKGSGKLEAIKGVDSLGYMAKDGAGHWYATIDAATQSGGREFIVLRDTDPAAPAGWKFVKKDGITKLVKVAKGMFFMAY